MSFNYDPIISFLILAIFFLTIWAKATQQTIKELLKSIAETVREVSDDGQEAYY